MQDDALIGAQLGAYTIQYRLGEGGMARVYKASHTLLERDVAIKVILPESAALAEFQQRFKQEAQVVAHLQHRNIVTLYDYGEQGELVYLVMPYVAGGTLRNQMRPGQPIEPRRAALYILQMTRALYHAHQQGIVHRDVKPLNMLVSANNRNELLLSDFGLAKLFTSTQSGLALVNSRALQEHLTHTQGMAGTPSYMAPEQCLGNPLDARTDIYALGVILFEMLTGHHPYENMTGTALLYHHAYVAPPSMQTFDPALPDLLVQIVERAMAKDPDQRYQTAKDMGLHLEEFLSPPMTVPLPPPPVIVPPRKKNQGARYWFSLVLSLVLLVFGIVSYLRISPSTNPVLPTFSSYTNSCGEVSGQKYPIATPFDESFEGNGRVWPQDSGGEITLDLKPHTYSVDIADSRTSFFLCPDPMHVGLLPTNFSLSVHMTQMRGANSLFYGIAFRAARKNGLEISSYAFLINGEKTAAFFEYGKQFTNGVRSLQFQRDVVSIQSVTHENTLQVIVHGGQVIGMINGQSIQFSVPVNVTSLTEGQLGVVVSGPNSGFTITQVQLGT